MIHLDHNHHPSPLDSSANNAISDKTIAFNDGFDSASTSSAPDAANEHADNAQTSALGAHASTPTFAGMATSRASTPLSEPPDDIEPARHPATSDLKSDPSTSSHQSSPPRHTSRPPSTTNDPSAKISLLLDLNSELFKVVLGLQSRQGPSYLHDPRFQAYNQRLSANLNLLQTLHQTPAATSIPPLDPPPPVDFMSIQRIQQIYATELPALFSREPGSASSSPSASSSTSLKRERIDDELSGGQMKRRNTGETTPRLSSMPPPSTPQDPVAPQPQQRPQTPTSVNTPGRPATRQQMRPPSRQQQTSPSLAPVSVPNPMGAPGSPPDASGTQYPPGLPPQMQQAYNILVNNPGHPMVQQMNRSVPGFSQMPITQQLRRVMMVQQQQQQLRASGPGAAGAGAPGMPPNAGNPMAMGPGNPGGGAGQYNPGANPAATMSPMMGSEGMSQQQQRQMMMMRQNGMTQNGMTPQQQQFALMQQQRMRQQQMQAGAPGSPMMGGGGDMGGGADTQQFPALRSNAPNGGAIPGIARSARSPSNNEEMQRMMFQQQQQRQAAAAGGGFNLQPQQPGGSWPQQQQQGFMGAGMNMGRPSSAGQSFAGGFDGRPGSGGVSNGGWPAGGGGGGGGGYPGFNNPATSPTGEMGMRSMSGTPGPPSMSPTGGAAGGFDMSMPPPSSASSGGGEFDFGNWTQ